jgi:hypothetical protein
MDTATRHRIILRRMLSRLLLAAGALSWLAWLVAAPSAWTGCKFVVGTIQLSANQNITITAADDLDLSAIEVAYAKISAPEQREYRVNKPADGWPKTVIIGTDVTDPIDITVTVYDAQSHLIGLGTGVRVGQDTEVLVQATIPWS